MRSVILHCPSLGRDLAPLLAAVPGALVHEGPRMPGQGWEASKIAHHAIITETKALGEPCVFVMEDDCQFTAYFDLDCWEEDATWSARHGYDILIGGSTRTYDERWVRDGMVEVSAFHSSHCVVYFASGYDKVLRAGAPIDITPGRDCGARCVVAWPFVAVQRPAFSGCEGHDVDYVPLYEQHEARLGALMRVSA